MSKVEIKIGEKTYEIEAPFRFKVLERFEPAFIRWGGLLNKVENMQALGECIVLAINDTYPDFKHQTLQDARITPTELMAIGNTLGKASGIFIERKEEDKGAATAEKEPGEEQKA